MADLRWMRYIVSPSEMVAQEGRMYWDVLAMYRHLVLCFQLANLKSVQALKDLGI